MLQIILTILQRKKYLAIALFTTFIMSAASYYLTVINVFSKRLVIYAQMNGYWFTTISLMLSMIISILFGVYVGLLFFRRDIVKARAAGNKIAGAAGAISGVIASGCSSCGAPLLGFIGLPAGLFSLPFRGLELKTASVGLLVLSIYLISKNIGRNLTCGRK